MPEPNPEHLAARLLAGELSEAEARQLRRQIDADPAARAALARQEATIVALRQWRDGQPHQPVPTGVARQRWRRFWVPSLAAAAALLLAVGLYLALPRSRPSTAGSFGGAPAGARDDWARDTFAFLLDAGPRPPGASGVKSGGPAIGAPGSRPSDRGSSGLGGGSYGGGPKGSKPGAVNVDKLRSQVDFAFRLPQELPQGYALQEAAVLSRQTLRLKYTAGERSLLVWLKPSAGPDAPVEPLDHPQRKILVIRRSGLGIAMQGSAIDRAFVEACSPEFVPQR